MPVLSRNGCTRVLNCSSRVCMTAVPAAPDPYVRDAAANAVAEDLRAEGRTEAGCAAEYRSAGSFTLDADTGIPRRS